MPFQFLRDWLDVAQFFGLIIGFVLTIVSIRQNTKERRISNLLTITSHHRELWQHFSDRPELHRIFKRDISLSKKPATVAEREFVNRVILHVKSALQVYNSDASFSRDGFRRDVAEFLTLPIPRVVWNDSKIYHEEVFVRFVESVLEN